VRPHVLGDERDAKVDHEETGLRFTGAAFARKDLKG
jgi:hypothetical protein